MKVIKNINNNVSLCLDSKGKEVIAFGKGIGFTKPPYDIPLEKIQRTFYDINERYVNVITNIPEEYVLVATKIIDSANRLNNENYSDNAIFTLADHLMFAVKRHQQNIHISLPVLYEVKHSYPDEMKLAKRSLKIINQELNVQLNEEEAASIALHFVDCKMAVRTNVKEELLINKTASYIEKVMNVTIDKNSFNYSRFVTHMHYLLERGVINKSITSDNRKLFEAIVKEYPNVYQCAIGLKEVLKMDFSDEEILYLIIHINRVASR